MHPITIAKRLLLSGLAASIVGFGGAGTAHAQPAAAAQPAKSPAVKIGKGGELLVPVGGIVRFQPKKADFKDVLTGNPDVLEAKPDPNDPGSILLVGRNPGVTKLTLTFPNGDTTAYEVLIQPDYDLLRKVISRAVPTASVEVIPGVGTGIILTGYVNKPEDAQTIQQIAQNAAGTTGGQQGGAGGLTNVINAIQVGGVQHVQIEVVVASVSRTELRQRGADFIINGTSASFSSLISGLLTPGATSITNSTANLNVGIAPAGLVTALQALKSESLAKILSEPKVVTQSGRPAVIRSGGQQAVLSSSAGGLGSISVALEEVGTTLNVLPIVYGNGKIYLDVAPTIRNVDNGRGIQTSAGFSPGFTQQSTRATVMLESGQTFAIGGLLEQTHQGTATKVPVLGELPYVGAAFSTIRYEDRETELIILVTPRLVDALDCTQTPRRVPGRETRTPDDYEFYLEGLLELPRGQRQVWNGRCYNAAWKCDTNGLFPCKGNVCGGPAGECATGTCPATVHAFGVTHAAAVTPQPAPALAIEPAPTAPAIVPAEATAPAAPVEPAPQGLPAAPPAIPPAPAGGGS